MSEPITASVSDPVTDSRPEPPGLTATLYLCRWWEWRVAQWKDETDGWRLRCSHFPHVDTKHWKGLERAQAEAAELVAKGCRNVRIVTIPGDLA